MTMVSTDSARVAQESEHSGLAMSRSLCDEVAKRAGVISDPDVQRAGGMSFSSAWRQTVYGNL